MVLCAKPLFHTVIRGAKKGGDHKFHVSVTTRTVLGVFASSSANSLGKLEVFSKSVLLYWPEVSSICFANVKSS